MQRIPEPELMDDLVQAKAYHDADFSESHGLRVDLFRERVPTSHLTGKVLDIGCGSGDIVFRFAKAFKDLHITAVDGSDAMLDIAREDVANRPEIKDSIEFAKAFIPSDDIPKNKYNIIMSHSFLHHLHDPSGLWQTIKQHAKPNTFVFVADLRRPASTDAAQAIIDEQAADEPEVLRIDYYNSLCAALTPDEISQQLSNAGLDQLNVEAVGENYVLVYGLLA